MQTQTTAIGRTIPAHEGGIALQDLVLKLLFDFSTSPFNAGKAPLPLASLAKAARAELEQVRATAVALARQSPPLVEKVDIPDEAYRITGQGLIFVQNASAFTSGS